MPSLNDPSALHDILVEIARKLQHTPKIDLIELAIDHSFQQVGTKLQVPVPPSGPYATAQGLSPFWLKGSVLTAEDRAITPSNCRRTASRE